MQYMPIYVFVKYDYGLYIVCNIDNTDDYYLICHDYMYIYIYIEREREIIVIGIGDYNHLYQLLDNIYRP